MAGQWLTPVRRVAGVAVTLAVLATGCLPADPPTAASPRPTSSPAGGVEADERPPAAVGTATEQPTPRASGPAVRQARSSTALPASSGSGRRVVYSVARQRVWVVDASGQVARTYLVSGRRSQPGPGTFRVYSRSRHTASAVSDETMEYMVRFTHGRRTGAAIGFHSIPVDHLGRPAQTEQQLGQPLSAGCIRQRAADARYLWDFATLGTKVVVVR